MFRIILNYFFFFTNVSPFVLLVCKNSNRDDLQVHSPVQDMEHRLRERERTCTVCSAEANLSVTKTN